MRKLKRSALHVFVLLMLQALPMMVLAQDEKSSSGSFMRSQGRSYVVIAVMLTILIGLFIYLARIDRKITKWEKE